MRYLLSWIAEYLPHETPSLPKILAAFESLGLSVEGVEGMEPDAIIDLELPFHRWDLTSLLGIARELSIYFWRERSKSIKSDLELSPLGTGNISAEIKT